MVVVPFVAAPVYWTSYWWWYPNVKGRMTGQCSGPKERVTYDCSKSLFV